MMGIKYLYKSLVNRIEQEGLQDSQIHGALVIDGFNLAGKLYTRGKHSQLEGGEYPAFYEHVRRYFQQLIDCGIEPIVVFDGSIRKYSSSEAYQKGRRENRIKKTDIIRKIKSSGTMGNVQPPFLSQVFIDAIESVIHETCPGRIRVYCADRDGDSEIAAVANDYQCPVYSSDSDFFMFELIAGFVIRKFFRMETKNGSSKAFGKIFYPQRSFIDGSIGLHFHDPNLRFIIPAIKGNGFIECLDIEYKGHKLTEMDQIIQYAQSVHTIEDFHHDDLSTNYKEAKDYYKEVKAIKLEDASEQTSLQLPEWVLCCYRKGQFHRWMVQTLMEKSCPVYVTIEDMGRPSCHEASKEIREFIQGTLVGETGVTEYIRDQREGCSVSPKPLARQPWPDLQNLDKLSRDKRMEIVCKVLDYDQQTLITELEPEWQLVVAASSFWLRSTAPEEREKLARALVSCFIHCQREHICVLPPHKDILVTEPISSQLPLIHCFSQWQSVYYFTVMLNQLLLEPFQYTSPGRIFDGRRALRFAIQERENKMDLCQCADLTLHEKLYRLIIKSNEHQELYQEEQVTIQHVLTANMFAGLTDDCSD